MRTADGRYAVRYSVYYGAQRILVRLTAQEDLVFSRLHDMQYHDESVRRKAELTVVVQVRILRRRCASYVHRGA